jgi:hypothetical protein
MLVSFAIKPAHFDYGFWIEKSMMVQLTADERRRTQTNTDQDKCRDIYPDIAFCLVTYQA